MAGTRGGRRKRAGPNEGRRGKLPKNLHPGITFEQTTGPVPKYVDRTLHSFVPSASGTIAESVDGGSSHTLSSRPNGTVAESVDGESVRTISNRPSRRQGLRDELTDRDSDDEPLHEGSGTIGGTTPDVGGGSGRVRGDALPVSPLRPGQMKPKVKIYYGKLIGPGVSRFFLKQIKRNIDGCWEHYENIPPATRDEIWKSFLERYNVEGNVDLACEIFEQESKKTWSNFLSNSRRRAIKKNCVNSVEQLLGKPMPTWLASEAVWEQYVRHWSKPEQMAISIQASKNRQSPAGRPNGKMAVHPLGSKSLQERMFIEERETGVTPSVLGILADLNKKKNKDTNVETGEFYDVNFQASVEQYKPMFRAQYGEDKDPLKMPLVKKLWTKADPVKGGLGKGRLLGVGTSSAAVPLMVDDLDERPSVVKEVDDLKRQCEDEKTRNKGLEEQVGSMRSEMSTLSAIVIKFLGSALNPVDNTGLLAQMHQLQTLQIMRPTPDDLD